MGDEVDGIVAGHLLLLQEIGRIRFTFGENGHQDVRAGHFGPARALHVDRGALDHALERGGRHRFGAVHVGDEVGKIVLDEFNEGLAEVFGIHRTGLHHLGRVRFVDQRQQQVLQRREFVTSRVRECKRGVDCLFQCRRE